MEARVSGNGTPRCCSGLAFARLPSSAVTCAMDPDAPCASLVQRARSQHVPSLLQQGQLADQSEATCDLVSETDLCGDYVEP